MNISIYLSIYVYCVIAGRLKSAAWVQSSQLFFTKSRKRQRY